ncbi:hypothetical protein V6N11_061117 [Hibiscus sabdariffa]|uniref:Uncharacterized protein n=2 Tax=Hibiscus sabdariffa TaxID=183260 RepID=A0ABR2AU08_9ROSI
MRLQILKVPNSKLVGKVSIRELLRLKFPNNNRVGKTSIGKLHWLKNPIKQTGGEGVKKRTATDEDVRSRVDVQVVPDIENLILEEEEDDALNAILMSKDGSAGCNLGNETESFLGEMELVGKANVASQKLISVQAITNQGELEGLDQVKSLIQMLDNVKSSWADVLKEVLDYSRGSKDSEPVKGLGVIESRAAGPGRAKTNLIHSSGPCLRSVGPSLNERPLDRIEVLNQMSKGS